jgi:hypothetical protein
MRSNIHLIAGVTAMLMAMLMVSACNKANSPETEANGIAAAHDSAVKEVAKAETNQQHDMSADGYNVAVAQADGDHKIAIQKCDALAGHEQKTCKDQADADYEAAKANAKAKQAGQQP